MQIIEILDGIKKLTNMPKIYDLDITKILKVFQQMNPILMSKSWIPGAYDIKKNENPNGKL